MSAILDLIGKFKSYIFSRSGIHYRVGLSGVKDFIFEDKISNKTIKKLFFLTHFNQGHRDEVLNMVMNDPQMKAVLEQRLVTRFKLKELANYPKSSLGYCYQKFLIDNGITPFVFSPKHLAKCDPYTYIILRIYMTHDIYHVLLNEDTGDISEGVVAAFTLAQLPKYPAPGVHIAAGTLRLSLDSTRTFNDVIPRLYRAGTIGREAKQLFAVNWNDYWKKDLEEVRRELNIKLE